MRIFFIVSFLLLIYACDNNLSTLGGDLISNENFIEVKRFVMEETSTVRLDSFPTSNISSSSSSLSPLTMGKITDKVTGSITAVPYFQVAPQGLVSTVTWESNCTFDSITLQIPYIKTLAGDSTAFQIFDLYQTTEPMRFDRYNPILCNIDSLTRGKKLATLQLYPQKDNIAQAYFKLDYEFGLKLFNRMRSRDHSFDQINYPEFMEEFNALAIIPREENSILMSINPANLALKFHYHIGSVEAADGTSFSWPIALPSNTYTPVETMYAFTHLGYTPEPEFENITFREPKSFEDLTYKGYNMAVIEGMNGLMTRLKVPFIADEDVYKTIMKAEIELRINTDLLENNILEPQILGVYVVTKDNFIKGLLTTTQGDVIYGTLTQNSIDPNERSYIIDITDYYSSLVEGVPPIVPEIYLLIGLPGSYYSLLDDFSYQIFTGNVANTFQRVVLKEQPKLNIYYSHYN